MADIRDLKFRFLGFRVSHPLLMNIKETERDFGDEEKIVIKDHYNHKNEPWSHEVSQKYPSIYIMFDKSFNVHWCPSGNELRRIYLENPSNWISEPIYVAIPRYVDAEIKGMMDNF